MKIISHRGYWRHPEEKNAKIAFDRSFSLGFGTETDIRDYCEELVISHDIPTKKSTPFSDFLANATAKFVGDGHLTLALNVKADGLADKMAGALNQYKGLDPFVFDMSVPDMRSYFDAGIPVFTRLSEVEKNPVWIERSAGVWLDGFESEWYAKSVIEDLLMQGKRVCIVSPELHRREYHELWRKIKAISSSEKLILCTDVPEVAAEFFHR